MIIENRTYKNLDGRSLVLVFEVSGNIFTITRIGGVCGAAVISSGKYNNRICQGAAELARAHNVAIGQG